MNNSLPFCCKKCLCNLMKKRHQLLLTKKDPILKSSALAILIHNIDLLLLLNYIYELDDVLMGKRL